MLHCCKSRGHAGCVSCEVERTFELMGDELVSGDVLVDRWRNATGSARERAGEELLERYRPVITAVAKEHAGARGGRARQTELAEELVICLFEAAASYDVGKSAAGDGGFEHWVRFKMGHHLSSLKGAEGQVDLPESWRRVGRIAARVEDHLTQQLKRLPTSGEVRDGTLEYSLDWARDRARESGRDGDIEVQARSKLRKQGTLGAIEQLDTIRAMRAPSLDVDVELAGRGVDDDSTSAVAGVFRFLNDDERFIVERRLGFFDGCDWTFEEIAAELDMAWPEVRKTLVAALAKPKAPHAQYVYLAGIDHQVDDDFDDPVERFRQRATTTTALTTR
jgi:hypothetical protein